MSCPDCVLKISVASYKRILVSVLNISQLLEASEKELKITKKLLADQIKTTVEKKDD